MFSVVVVVVVLEVVLVLLVLVVVVVVASRLQLAVVVVALGFSNININIYLLSFGDKFVCTSPHDPPTILRIRLSPFARCRTADHGAIVRGEGGRLVVGLVERSLSVFGFEESSNR